MHVCQPHMQSKGLYITSRSELHRCLLLQCFDWLATDQSKSKNTLPSFRPSVRPTLPKCAPVHNACLPSTVERACTTATSWFSICVTCSCSSGWSTSPSHWASAPWLGPSRRTTGPWRSQMTSLPARSTPLSAEPFGRKFSQFPFAHVGS